uniref:ABC transport system, sugar-binding protein n=1 Tax=uncultured bacterium contig00031 TaxID=1181520 RepID=A0A806KM62_9BACT|nr:ABC transport system, sugar-binding protein [uncultured bacterium contig00031]
MSIKKVDVILFIAVLLVLISPVVVRFFFNKVTDTHIGNVNKHIDLFLSSRCEELLGKEMTETLLNEFNRQNPDLLIQLSDNSNDREPDIFIFDNGEYSTLVARETLEELNSFTNYKTDTRQLAIPLVSFMDLLFYNIDILTAVGFDRPPRTREEFLAYARTVSGSNDELLAKVSGAAISLSPADKQALSRDVFSWIWAAGGDFWSTEDEPSLNARAISGDISFLGRLYRENALAPGIYYTTGDQRLEEFAQGRIAMMISSTRAIPSLRERMGDDKFGITTIPGSDSGGKYNIGISSIYAGLNVNSENHDEAWRFLEFLAERSPFFCEVFKAVPGIVSDIIPASYTINDMFYSKAMDIFEASEIIQGFSGKPGAEKYETAFLEELQSFFESNRTAQETVSTIQQRWRQIDENRAY